MGVNNSSQVIMYSFQEIKFTQYYKDNTVLILSANKGALFPWHQISSLILAVAIVIPSKMSWWKCLTLIMVFICNQYKSDTFTIMHMTSFEYRVALGIQSFTFRRYNIYLHILSQLVIEVARDYRQKNTPFFS